jgi:hypothetical protein
MVRMFKTPRGVTPRQFQSVGIYRWRFESWDLVAREATRLGSEKAEPICGETGVMVLIGTSGHFCVPDNVAVSVAILGSLGIGAPAER